MRDDEKADSENRLNGWKEIANFFARDERTVKRWEQQRGLPVHRLPGGGRAVVYAYRQELKNWLANAVDVGDQGRDSQRDPLQPAAPRPLSGTRGIAIVAIGLVAIGGLLAIATGAIDRMFSDAKATKSIAQDKSTAQQAEDLYLTGVYLWQKRTIASIPQAIDALEKAVGLDPGHASAYAALATAHNLSVEYGLATPEEGYAQARLTANRAIALDATQVQAQCVLADIEVFWLRQISQGLARFRRAVDIDPRSVQARHWYASALAFTGRAPEALEQVQLAQQLDPQSKAIAVTKALALFRSGNVSAAKDILTRIAANEPDYMQPYRFLAFIHLAQSEYAIYLDMLERQLHLEKNRAGPTIVASGRAGLERSGIEGMVDGMIAAASSDLGSVVQSSEQSSLLAHLYGLKGDWETAARFVSSIKTRRVFDYGFDPAFRTIRTHPKFQARIVAAGLPAL